MTKDSYRVHPSHLDPLTGAYTIGLTSVSAAMGNRQVHPNQTSKFDGECGLLGFHGK